MLADKIAEPTAEQIASAFARAIAAASAYRGATSPNPPVGCVVLDAHGSELAVAAHQKAGEGHAEKLALAQCYADGKSARIHSVVVTLEPCNHTGLTPPCCDAILATPAMAVWIGSADPNPAVKGGGAERLAAAGLQVRSVSQLRHAGAKMLATACADLIAPFASRMQRGRPYITVKQAVDEVGSMIPPTGAKTFTSQSSLVLAHELRKRADAIVTGSGTVLADDPHFTVRHVPDHPGKKRLLLILDRRERVPRGYLEASLARGLVAQTVTSFDEALRRAHAAGALEVLVEAGPTVTQTILNSGLWDEHVLIRKQAGLMGIDVVEIRHSADTSNSKENHVLRHH